MFSRGQQPRSWNPRLVGLVALAILVTVAVARANEGAATSFGVKVTTMRVRSDALHESFLVGLASPPGGSSGRPLLVLLPQSPAQPGTSLTRPMLAAMAVLGARSPDIALPAGPVGVYANASVARTWESFLLRSVIPAVRARVHARAGRITVGAIGAGAPSAAALLDRARGSFCQAPADARLSLAQAQKNVSSGGLQLQPASAANSDSPAVYGFLDAYATALQRCVRESAG
jgi:hypothetical protein